MNNKGALKNASEDFNALRKEWELLSQEKVGKQINACILMLINEVDLSKMPKSSLDWSSRGSIGWLAIGQ